MKIDDRDVRRAADVVRLLRALPGCAYQIMRLRRSHVITVAAHAAR
jgi:hypothetical protein